MKRKSVPPPKSSKHFAASVSRPPTEAAIAPLLRLIDKAEVMRRVPYTYPSIWKKMQEGTFPRSRNMGGKTCWLESDINDWIASRPVQPLKGDSTVVEA